MSPLFLALIVAAYLLGSVSFSLLMVRALRDVDVRSTGSGNAGATNVLRTAGMAPALAVLLLDAGKGALAVLAARVAGAPGPIVGGCALAAVVGHVWPIYSGFRGGKGVATASGALAPLAPRALLMAAGVFLALVAATRYVSLGSIVAAALVPLLILAASRAGWGPPAPDWLLVSAAAISLLVVFKHRNNLRRLAAGEESRLDVARGRERLD